MVFPRRVVHLTVDPEGQISMWDDRERAMLGKQKDEVYLQLLLSLSQTEKVKQAQRQAQRRKKPN